MNVLNAQVYGTGIGRQYAIVQKFINFCALKIDYYFAYCCIGSYAVLSFLGTPHVSLALSIMFAIC